MAARCKKLALPLTQGVPDKASALQALIAEHRARPESTIYLGNDMNDAVCFPLVGCALVVADAHPQARALADRVLSRPGGRGAVRELCDLILEHHTRGN